MKTLSAQITYIEKKIKTRHAGFTLVELALSVAIAIIAMLGMAVVFTSSHRAYEVLYNKANAGVVTDGYYARKLFDTLVRKSAAESSTVDKNGTRVELRYYADTDSEYPDRYARFYTTDRQLKLRCGTIDAGDISAVADTSTVCEDLSDCAFKRYGNSIVMILTLDDGEKSNTIVTSAYPHN